MDMSMINEFNCIIYLKFRVAVVFLTKAEVTTSKLASMSFAYM